MGVFTSSAQNEEQEESRKWVSMCAMAYAPRLLEQQNQPMRLSRAC